MGEGTRRSGVAVGAIFGVGVSSRWSPLLLELGLRGGRPPHAGPANGIGGEEPRKGGAHWHFRTREAALRAEHSGTFSFEMERAAQQAVLWVRWRVGRCAVPSGICSPRLGSGRGAAGESCPEHCFAGCWWDRILFQGREDNPEIPQGPNVKVIG